jgi:predicted nuclease of predicted toxin-antitoxin system
MRLFADENMARAIVVRLRVQGHDVLYASEIQPGAADSDWLSTAEAEARIILTADKDFGDLIFRDRLTSHGVVRLRLGDMPLKDRLTRLEQAWPSVEAHPVGRFIVITPTKIRVRSLGTWKERHDLALQQGF